MTLEEHPDRPASIWQASPTPALASTMSLLSLIASDVRAKARWCYESDDWKAIVKVLATDGTLAMVLYRLMQWSRRYRLVPLEMVFNKLNGICCQCIIGRGAEFGPGFVLIHSQGVVVNGKTRGGANVHLEHQVTIGAARRQMPVLGSNIFVGAGAKIIGAVTLGDGARGGANAVVVSDVPPGATVVGIPARVVRQRSLANGVEFQAGSTAERSGDDVGSSAVYEKLAGKPGSAPARAEHLEN